MLILVRHGRTAHNASRRLLGRLDPPLDRLGGRQAAALAASGVLAGVERVVSSPLLRARSTAEAFGRTVELDERWVEVDYGVYDGLPVADVSPSAWASWDADPEWAPDGGESLAAVGRRVRAACEELWACAAAGPDVAVVTHVSPIKAALAWALGVGDEATTRMFVEVASVHRIGPGRRGPALYSFNEVHQRPSA
jgi:broad specificity phosphatase PhoE